MKTTLSIICVSLVFLILFLIKLAVLIKLSNSLKSPHFPIAKEALAKQEETSSKVDLKIFQFLQRQRLELAKREERLSNEEYRLKILKEQIENKVEELKKIRDEIKKGKENVVTQSREGKPEGHTGGLGTNSPVRDKLGQLARIYESTLPEQAGPLLEKLDAKVAAMILVKMNERKAGKILGFVNPANAAKISQEMVK